MNAPFGRYVVTSPAPGVFWVLDVVLDRLLAQRPTRAAADAMVAEFIAFDAALKAPSIVKGAAVLGGERGRTVAVRDARDEDDGRGDEDHPDAGWVDGFNAGQWGGE